VVAVIRGHLNNVKLALLSRSNMDKFVIAHEKTRACCECGNEFSALINTGFNNSCLWFVLKTEDGDVLNGLIGNSDR
jgi:hypothetical protein